MKFEQQKITIPAREKTGEDTTRTIAATVGVGSGLCYHHPLGGDEDGYTLTHLSTGRSIGGEWIAETEEEAQTWLLRVAAILDWTADRQGIKTQLQSKGWTGPSLKQRIEEALTQGGEKGHA